MLLQEPFTLSSDADRAPQLKASVGWLLNLMSLEIFWESERGEIIERCPRSFNPWKYMDHPDEVQSTWCLRFIDEYGDTTFNQYQLPVLVEELESIHSKSKDSEARESLESIIAFIRKCHDHAHTYVKFLGD